MVLVKILGAVDLAAAFAFLLLIFSINLFVPFTLFCAGLLLIKGFFVLTGDILSIIDLFAAACLFLSLIITLPAILLWLPAFFLLAKGVVSFL